MSYSARVTALADSSSAYLDSLPSSLRSFNTPISQLPDITLVIASISGNTLNINWEFPSSSNNNIEDFNVNLIDRDSGFSVNTDFTTSRFSRFYGIGIPNDIGRGGSFRVTITANPESGYRASSGRVDFSIPSLALPSPQGLEIDMETHNGARATWESVDNATSYVLYVYNRGETENPILTYTRNGNTNVTYTFSSNSLDPFTLYTVRVIARGGVGLANSLPSSRNFRTTKERLATPNRPSVIIISSDVAVSWRTVDSNAVNISVELLHDEDGDGIFIRKFQATIGGNTATSYTFRDILLPNVNYRVIVTAIASFSSEYINSLPSSFRSFSSGTLQLPTLEVTSASSLLNSLIIRWSINSNSNSNIEDFTLELEDRDSGTAFSETYTVSRFSRVYTLNISNVIGRGGSFRVTITANPESGYRASSDNLTFDIPNRDLPSMSVSLENNTTDSSLDANWSISPGTNISSFFVELIGTTLTYTLFGGSAPPFMTSFSYVNIGAVGTYSAKVTARGKIGFNDRIITSSSVTIASQTLSSPSSLIFSDITQNSFTISWTGRDDNATGYEYQYREFLTNDAYIIGSTTATSVDISNLNHNTTYLFQVKAVNNTNFIYTDSSFLTDDETTEKGTLSNPTSRSHLTTTSSITYRWNTVTSDTNGNSLSGANVRYVVRVGGSVVQRNSNSTYTRSGLSEDTTYSITVVAEDTNDVYNDSSSVTLSAITTEKGTLSNPTSRSHLTTTSSITYRWNTVTSDTNGNSLSGANVRYVVRVGGSVVQRNSNSTYTRSGLK